MASFIGVASSLGKKKLTRIAISDQGSQFLELDATISTAHESRATITKHPVEKGVNISDHIRREPDMLQIDGVVSNTPVLLLASLRAKPSVPGGNPRTRAEDAFEFLNNIMNNGQTVTATTLLRDYRSMAISSIGVMRDKDTSNIVRLQIRLEEIAIAVTEVNVPEPVNPSRQKRTNNGKKTKKKASAKADTKKQSILFALTR